MRKDAAIRARWALGARAMARRCFGVKGILLRCGGDGGNTALWTRFNRNLWGASTLTFPPCWLARASPERPSNASALDSAGPHPPSGAPILDSASNRRAETSQNELQKVAACPTSTCVVVHTPLHTNRTRRTNAIWSLAGYKAAY